MTIALFGLLLVYVVAVEVLDWHGRMEIIQKRWPRLWVLMSERPARLVLLVAIAALLAADVRKEVPRVPNLSVRFPAPSAPRLEAAKPCPKCPTLGSAIRSFELMSVRDAPRLDFVLTTEKLRTPVDLLFTCDFPIGDGDLTVLTRDGTGAAMLGKGNESSNQFRFRLGSPAWTPASPLRATIYFAGKPDRMPSCSLHVD